MLRHAREGKGLSLDDIAQATRINHKALEDLENDVPLRLPPTYVRAFLKAFAQQVGLDPSEILKLVESASVTVPATEGTQAFSPLREEVNHQATPVPSVEGTAKNNRRQIRGLIIFSSLTAAGLVASLFWLQREHTMQSVQEISFPEIMKEQEAKHTPPAAQSTTDSVQGAPSPQPKPSVIDSLLLEGVAVESTWVRLSSDSAAAKEYSVPPQVRMKWKAAKSFTLTVGNGGGMYFTLNGTRLGTFGQANKPVKDISLSHETLSKPEKPTKPLKKKG